MVKKVLILGSAALKIGEAGEFDYSGSQAIKALKEEGIHTILVNPNIATIQTSENLADEIYFLPVNAEFVEKVIKKTRPDGILLSFGGQTALNTGLELHRRGILQKYDVAILGTPIQAIKDTEDRQLFIRRLQEIEVKTARSQVATTLDEALQAAEALSFPVIIRIAYALGGLGSGVCRNLEEFRDKAEKALTYAPQILIEEYLEGWKEIEYEVICDGFNNCLTICNMENVDPMGIHTGESIVVAPCQTLSNSESHKLRSIAIQVVRHLGIVGECNIQFALDPRSEDYRVIEVNARLSRSSALASKATGYPIAFIAAKLALGYGLHQLPNKVTRTTTAFFEPALDYIVVKIPRWDLKKFRNVSHRIGSGMKSVGEVMAIGRTFEEALQKGLRMLETGANGIVGNDGVIFENLERELSEPTDERIFAVAEALQQGYDVAKIARLTNINPWFIYKIRNIVAMNTHLSQYRNQELPTDTLLAAKKLGFSDKQIAFAIGKSEAEVHQLRLKANIRPYIRQIDTLAAEFPAYTNYLYLTYNAIRDDISFTDSNVVMILGS
nr:carbamoyl-phosphate synthase large subunit [Candidatus Neomarinimicrobiota bacterium]